MLTTCRVIFFIISARLFYICIKRKCLRTRVPPSDNVGTCADCHRESSPCTNQPWLNRRTNEFGRALQFSARCRSFASTEEDFIAEGVAAFYLSLDLGLSLGFKFAICLDRGKKEVCLERNFILAFFRASDSRSYRLNWFCPFMVVVCPTSVRFSTFGIIQYPSTIGKFCYLVFIGTTIYFLSMSSFRVSIESDASDQCGIFYFRNQSTASSLENYPRSLILYCISLIYLTLKNTLYYDVILYVYRNVICIYKLKFLTLKKS